MYQTEIRELFPMANKKWLNLKIGLDSMMSWTHCPWYQFEIQSEKFLFFLSFINFSVNIITVIVAPPPIRLYWFLPYMKYFPFILSFICFSVRRFMHHWLSLIRNILLPPHSVAVFPRIIFAPY